MKDFRCVLLGTALGVMGTGLVLAAPGAMALGTVLALVSIWLEHKERQL